MEVMTRSNGGDIRQHESTSHRLDSHRELLGNRLESFIDAQNDRLVFELNDMKGLLQKNESLSTALPERSSGVSIAPAASGYDSIVLSIRAQAIPPVDSMQLATALSVRLMHLLSESKKGLVNLGSLATKTYSSPCRPIVRRKAQDLAAWLHVVAYIVLRILLSFL